MTKPAVMRTKQAVSMGFALDNRKRRRQHRQAARQLLEHGGQIFRAVAQWHLHQARWL